MREATVQPRWQKQLGQFIIRFSLAGKISGADSLRVSGGRRERVQRERMHAAFGVEEIDAVL